MNKFFSVLILFTGAITFSAAAQSAAIENTIGIGPRLGYYKAVDADDGNFYGGIQSRIRLGSHLGIEGSLEYRAGQEFGVADYTVKTRFIPVTTSLMLFIPFNEHFAPYGLAGLGAYHTKYDYSDAAEDLGFSDTTSYEVGYHLGFGLEVPITNNAAINVDYRYLFMDADDSEESFDDMSLDGNVFTVGLMFYL